MKKKTKRKLLTVLLTLAVVSAAVVGILGGIWYIDNKSPNFSSDYVLYVPEGMGADAVLDSL